MTRYLLALATTAIAACAQQQPIPEPVKTPEPIQEEQFVPPQQLNFTPFDAVLLNGRCNDTTCAAKGEYFSWNTKISFDIDAKWQLKVSDHQELSLSEQDDPADKNKCGPKGGTANQSTTWFPYTGIFVRGGRLVSVRDKSDARQNLLPLVAVEQGLTMVTGPSARKVEYAYVPCVGSNRVPSGHRLDGFLPRDSVLAIKPAKGRIIKLSLPDPVEPYVMLNFKGGTVVPVPMRPTLLTVDLVERRLVVYYQSTFPLSPPPHKVELRAILPGQEPGEGETPERYREQVEATLNYLRQCPIGQRPMEPCSTENQNPDPRILAH